MPAQRIALIGFSGSGKSLVGRMLAQKIGWASFDTDREIERNEGISVPSIFAERGEDEFRKLESAAVAAACSRTRVVISTGGGVPLATENRRHLLGCYIVLLDAPASALHRRLAQSAIDRPLLRSEDPETRIRTLKEERTPFYDIADLWVDTAGRTPNEVADEIRHEWRTASQHALADPAREDRVTSRPERRAAAAGTADKAQPGQG
ncbi:MAG: shikimate kinase [Dehalococcoidia bacterium]|nr:shikimate kinase [Dehalococcoidia bacterium]